MAGCAQAGAATPPPPRHVFLIVMENKSPQQALQGVFTASLAAKYRVAGNYTAIAHPSLPNYLALSSGQTWGVQDDKYHVLPQGGIGDELTAGGVSWRAYMEGMTGGQCLNSPYPYFVRHNPFAFYGGSCPDNVVPLTSLAADLNSSKAPMLSWISPDGCHDTHDCGLAVGDDWHEVSNQPYTHYSLLATMEDLLRVGRLGNAAEARPMTDLVG